MAQPSTLIPGTLLRETKIASLSSNVNKPDIFKLAEERQPRDYGIIDIWANKNVKDVPFMGGLIMNGDIEYVPGSIKFKLPTATDTSTHIINAPKGNRVGFGGEEFVIEVNNESLGGVGAVITFDKLSNAPELEVTGAKPLVDGKVSYRVKMVNSALYENSNRFVPSELLTSNSKLFKIASVRSSEFGQNFDSFSFKGTPEKEYIKELATAELQIHYHMTREAVRSANKMVMSEAGNRLIKDLRENMLEYMFMDSPVDPQFRYESEYVAAGSPGGAKQSGAALVTLMDDICFKILAKEENEYMMFGKGGPVGYGDGLDRGFLPIGIYHQADRNGYKDIYDLANFSEKTLLNAYRRYSNGKMPNVMQGKEPVVRVRTGKGGMELVSPIIHKYATDSLGGYLQNAESLGILSGNARTGIGVVKAFYTSLRIPGQVEFIFEQDPSFDPVWGHEILNPIVGAGFRLSSYSFIIDDFNLDRSNIKILRDENDENETTWFHQAGTEAHPFFKKTMNGRMGHDSNSSATGFKMFFTKKVSTPWMVDPTKMCKLVLKNPKLSNFSF